MPIPAAVPIALGLGQAAMNLFGGGGKSKPQVTEREYELLDPRLYEFDYETRGQVGDKLIDMINGIADGAGQDPWGFFKGGSIGGGGGASAGSRVVLGPAAQIDLNQDYYDPHKVSEAMLGRGNSFLRGQSEENIRLLNDRLALAGVDTASPIAMYLAEKQREALGQQQDRLYAGLLEGNIGRRVGAETFNTDYLNRFTLTQGQLDEGYQGRRAAASATNASLRQSAAQFGAQMGLARTDQLYKMIMGVMDPSANLQALETRTTGSGGEYQPSMAERFMAAAPGIAEAGTGIYNSARSINYVPGETVTKGGYAYNMPGGYTR